MLKRSFLLVALCVFGIDSAAAAPAPVAAPTAPYELMTNFVQQLGAFEEDRLRAAKDLDADKTDFASCVRNMTTFQLDLQNSISYFRSVRLSNDNMAKAFPSIFSAVLQQKYVIVGDIIKQCEAFIEPDPKIDYSQLAKRAPKLTAFSDYTDKTLFETSPGMFATLISPRADSKNRANHMVITRAQRDRLLESLKSYFGDELNPSKGAVPYYAAIAQLLRDKLNEFKCADDPWE